MRNNLNGYTADDSITYESLFGDKRKKYAHDAVFFDGQGNVVDKNSVNVQKAVITEKDELGQMISETFGSFETVSEDVKKKGR